jgi:hypothetical protein
MPGHVTTVNGCGCMGNLALWLTLVEMYLILNHELGAGLLCACMWISSHVMLSVLLPANYFINSSLKKKKVDTGSLNMTGWKQHLTSVSFSSKTGNSSLIMRKPSDTFQKRGTLQHTCPSLLQTAKVIKNKESLRNCHSPKWNLRIHTS